MPDANVWPEHRLRLGQDSKQDVRYAMTVGNRDKLETV